jgi:hypothetical protein
MIIKWVAAWMGELIPSPPPGMICMITIQSPYKQLSLKLACESSLLTSFTRWTMLCWDILIEKIGYSIYFG